MFSMSMETQVLGPLHSSTHFGFFDLVFIILISCVFTKTSFSSTFTFIYNHTVHAEYYWANCFQLLESAQCNKQSKCTVKRWVVHDSTHTNTCFLCTNVHHCILLLVVTLYNSHVHIHCDISVCVTLAVGAFWCLTCSCILCSMMIQPCSV